jgi:hypothetical protein
MGCSTNAPVTAGLGVTPSAATSEYLHTKTGGFVFTRGDSGAVESCRYVVLFAPAKPLAGPLYLRTSYENPADPSSPLVVDSVVPQNSDEFKLESPAVRGLRARHIYEMEIVIFDSSERTHQIGQHIQYVQSLVAFWNETCAEPSSGGNGVGRLPFRCRGSRHESAVAQLFSLGGMNTSHIMKMKHLSLIAMWVQFTPMLALAQAEQNAPENSTFNNLLWGFVPLLFLLVVFLVVLYLIVRFAQSGPRAKRAESTWSEWSSN